MRNQNKIFYIYVCVYIKSVRHWQWEENITSMFCIYKALIDLLPGYITCLLDLRSSKRYTRSPNYVACESHRTQTVQRWWNVHVFFTVWFVVYCLYVIYILYVYACIFNVSFIVFLAFIVLFTEVAIKKRHPENKKSEVIERVMWCQIKYGYGMLQLGRNE